MQVRVFNIDWCIEEEDLKSNNILEEDFLANLPEEVMLEVEGEDDIAEELSDETGMLVYGFYFEIIEE